MKLTVLGNSGRYLAPLTGGSSYLVETAQARILLDAGGGAREGLSRLGVERLDAIVISHFHFDHVLDLVTLASAMDARTTLVVPPGERKRLDALAAAYAFDDAYDVEGPIVDATGELQVGDARLSFANTQHSAPSVATRVEAEGRVLVYASDTAPCASLRGLATGADVLLMHTLLPTVDAASGHAQVHATAEGAGALAAAANARRLVLSHRFWESPDAAMREAAAKSFRDVHLARDDEVLEI